ncbi:MAG TPA: hypothetical protein VMT19_11480 [Thermoanaerobaculaceae bacterium]|nr:hypothetical protein [Thermoanaerobaculaceae bacterium]
MRASVVSATLAFASCCAAAGTAVPCGPWQWVNPLPQGDDLFGVTRGPGEFVAVGAAGKILASRDGTAWTCVDAGTTAALHAVTWDGSRYVAVGAAGTVLVGTDLAAWVPTGPAGTDDLLAVTSGGGQVVAVGDNGAIVTSADGVSWATRSSGTTLPLADVTWTGERYLAVTGSRATYRGFEPGNLVLSSADGRSWSVGALSEAIGLSGVASNGALSVAVGSFCGPTPFEGCGDGRLVATSADGESWSVRKYDGVRSFMKVVWSGSEFIAVGPNGLVATSPDGAAWSDQGSSADNALFGVAASGAFAVAVGQRGQVARSIDARTWAAVRSDVAPFAGFAQVVRTRSRWLVSGTTSYRTNPRPIVASSADGRTWEASADAGFAGCPAFGPVASDGAEFLALCGPDAVLTSADGIWWMLHLVGAVPPLTSLCWTGRSYLGFAYDVSGGLGSIYTSPDGRTWTFEFSTNRVFSAAASDGLATVATTRDGIIFRSASPGAWESIVWFGEGSGLASVAWGGGTFVAVGAAGLVASSPDGISWTTVKSGVTSDLASVAWDGGRFIAVGAGGTTIRSRNGIDWEADRPVTGLNLTAVAATAGCAVAVGDAGTILRTGCSTPRTLRRHLARNPSGAAHGWVRTAAAPPSLRARPESSRSDVRQP